MYLDGEVSAEDRALVEEHLKGCEGCASRADVYRRTGMALRAAALAEDAASLPAGLDKKIRKRLGEAARPSAGGLLVRAAPLVAAGLALGVAVAAFLRPAEREPARVPVVLRTVEHHTLDVPVDVASPDPAYVARFLRARVGHDVQIPRLDVAGYGLAGGRVVSLDDRRAAQLVYRGGLGRRLSVMAVPDPDGHLAASVNSEVKEALASGPVVLFHGQQGGFDVEVLAHQGTLYSLVADVDDARRVDFARSLTLSSSSR